MKHGRVPQDHDVATVRFENRYMQSLDTYLYAGVGADETVVFGGF